MNRTLDAYRCGIDAVDGDTVENRILKFGSDPTILAGVTVQGPSK